jgi:hypothetical protein
MSACRQALELSGLSEDLICSIFQFLLPMEILRVSETSYHLHKIIINNDHKLWKTLFYLQTKEYEYNIPTSSLLSRIESLGILTLKQCLRDYNVDISSFTHKKEYQDALSIQILAQYPSQIEISTWILHVPQWKASYYQAKRDVSRTKILKIELINTGFMFAFNSLQGNEFADVIIRFFDDFTMVSNINRYPYTWRVTITCIAFSYFNRLLYFIDNKLWYPSNRQLSSYGCY